MSPLLPYHNHHSTFIVSPYCQITITIPQSIIAIFDVSISPLSYCCIAKSPYRYIAPSPYIAIAILPYHHRHIAILPYGHPILHYHHHHTARLPYHLHYMAISPLHIPLAVIWTGMNGTLRMTGLVDRLTGSSIPYDRVRPRSIWTPAFPVAPAKISPGWKKRAVHGKSKGKIETAGKIRQFLRHASLMPFFMIRRG